MVAVPLAGRLGSELPQAPGPAEGAPGAALDQLISNAETLVTGVEEEMPDAKYSFAPTAGEFRGVRTFAKQLNHLAAVQYLAAFSSLGEPVTADMVTEQGPDGVRTKADIVAYVRGSFAALHRAAGAVDAANAFARIKDPFGSGTQTMVGLISG